MEIPPPLLVSPESSCSKGGAPIVQQAGGASPIVQRLGAPVVQQQNVPPAALIVQQTPTVVQQPTWPAAPSVPAGPIIDQGGESLWLIVSHPQETLYDIFILLVFPRQMCI